jgi:hypothetical protein
MRIRSEPPESVLSKVDEQLAGHGLKVVIYDAFDNAFSWRIEVREARWCRPQKTRRSGDRVAGQ